MTDPPPAPGHLPGPGDPPPTPTARARLRVLVPGSDADAVLDAARMFVKVVPVKDDVFDLEFHYADPLGAIPILDVFLRRSKVGAWREVVAIEMVPPLPPPPAPRKRR